MDGCSAGFSVFQSNDFEVLAARLMDDLARRGDDPFTPEPILVPNRAVAHALADRHAQRFGITAHLDFNFLARWLWQRIAALLPEARESPFRGQRLPWQIYRALGTPAIRDSHPRLARYLERAEIDPVMRLELAARVAGIFQRCIPWRPHWIRRWSQGELVPLAGFADEAWLAALWRWLAQEMGLPAAHPAEGFIEAISALSPVARAAHGVPPRVSVFCPAELPSLYLDLLARLGDSLRVNVYLLNPCEKYWELIVTPRRLARLEARDAADYHEVGHPLLAAWGRETQGLIAQMADLPAPAEEDAQFVASAGDSLLGRLQRGILSLDADTPVWTAQVDLDDSIEIHACHSFTRQLEVLHDRLLGRFAADPALRTSEILVVMPDLESRAPLIHAVFGSAARDRAIPYEVVGMMGRAANPAVAALLALLELLASRFLASEVFALIRHPLVSRRLALSAEALESLHDWMKRSDMRWGLDAGHRAALGSPATEAYTLREGLDRLFLGLALPEGSAPWLDLLPIPGIEGSEAHALGTLHDFVSWLDDARCAAARPQPAGAWAPLLAEWVTGLLPEDRDTLEATRVLREVLNEFFEDLAAACREEPLSLAVILAGLREQFAAAGGGAVPSGRVTFAPINALRFLPYRIICVLGLEDDAFPRRSRPDEFDPMGVMAQAGDPVARLADRNVFLDLLLAARDHLLLCYTGRSIRDNSALPPSIVISDLLECVAELSSPRREISEVRARLELVHPLQAFSPRYFRGDACFFSYANEYAEGLGARGTMATREFCASPLPSPATGEHAVALSQLARFIENPARHFLRRRLGLNLEFPETGLDDDEPDPGDDGPAAALAARLLPSLRAGLAREALRRRAITGREFSADAPGLVRIEQILDALWCLRGRMENLLMTGPGTELLCHHRVDLGAETWSMSGVLEDVHPAGRLVCQSKHRQGGGTQLRVWVFHLALQLARAALGLPGLPTFVLALDLKAARAPEESDRSKAVPPVKVGRFEALSAEVAAAHLDALLALYRSGLEQPLHFFPRTSEAYAKVGLKPRKSGASSHRDAALAAARKIWDPDHPKAWPERKERWIQQAMQGVPEPLDDAFERLAREVWGPALGAWEEDIKCP